MNTEGQGIAADAAGEAPASPAGATAQSRVDAVAIGAAVCIVIGWFLLNTVNTEMAGIRLGFHFYDMWSVLAHPTRLLTGLADGDHLRAVVFGVLCLTALAGVFVPQTRSDSRVRVAYLAPLVLMLICGALLYEKTSGDLLAQEGQPNEIGAHLIAFANTIAHRLSSAATHHISIGLGAYLAFAASLVLASRAVRRARAGSRYF